MTTSSSYPAASLPQRRLVEGKVTLHSDEKVKRAITKTMSVHEAHEGRGVKVRRFVGSRAVRCLPPFVICEHFSLNELGRPPHPSRGSQKITYVLKGRLAIEYSPANIIELGPGDVTSVMIGRGVIRSLRANTDEEAERNSEIQQSERNEGSYIGSKKLCKVSVDKDALLNDSSAPTRPPAKAVGLHIFLDVPESFKRTAPSQINLCDTEIAECNPGPGVDIRLITGSAFGATAEQMLTATPATMFVATLDAGSHLEIPVLPDWNAFIYMIEGEATVAGHDAKPHEFIEFMKTIQTAKPPVSAGKTACGKDYNEYISVQNEGGSHDVKFLFCAAKPLHQPIYRQGPFVDVSMDWIHQAFEDYTERKNGFESGQFWNDHAHSRRYTEYSDFDGPLYNPCEDEGPGEEKKVTMPNAFPPGKYNPASNSTEFNAEERVEEQQEEKLGDPRHRRSRKRARSSGTANRN